MVNSAPCEFWISATRMGARKGRSGGDNGKIEWKLTVVGDVISIRG